MCLRWQPHTPMKTVPRAGIFRHRDNEDPGSDQLFLEGKFKLLPQAYKECLQSQLL